ncbi:retrotransposable element Tf2 [Tanacetum coccineum]
MVVVDRFSKIGHFIPLSHPYTAITVAQAFLDNIYKLHGLPKLSISPTDGKTEVVNRSVEYYLRCMCGDKPKEWSNWIALVEYWYNTSYHTAINTTPFQVVFGQPPPAHITYNHGESPLETMDRSLVTREAVIDLLKFHLKRPQNRMKVVADKKIIEREFLIHPIFHVSQLKAHKGEPPLRPGTLPHYNKGLVVMELYAILDRKLAKSGNARAVYVLVRWTDGTMEDATWELYDDLALRFPEFDLTA